ncbi:MAG: hypothetical protein ACD_46C00627G0004 [uncultured bacterium]|nr:MAG: hypothetical protein ACD_46C00627G0004 [uncultured bacterium]
MKTNCPRPLTLIILDGFGYREERDANAIAVAHKPNWDNLWQHATHRLISGSGKCVGLPHGQMGNSEVGHLNIGAGRIVQQDLTRIDEAIENGHFFQNSILINAMQQAKQTNRTVHLMGLLSPGGVHSHEHHLHALIDLAHQHQVEKLYVHAFLDGRDTPPRSAMKSINRLENHFESKQRGPKGTWQIASLIGRFYAMDRDKRWDRIEHTYDLLTAGSAPFHATSAKIGLEMAYERGETDEFVQATAIHTNDHLLHVQDGDIIIFFNYRADRAREITETFINKNFSGFTRKTVRTLGEFVSLSEYDRTFDIKVAFAPESLNHIFADCISERGLKQLRIAETEKYAHVTFFFNGGVEEPYPFEDRILIPSPKIKTYDLQPEMSAPELTDRLIEAINSKKYDVIICNFANADMVGHTGNFSATVQAIEAIDECLGKITKALDQVGGELLITADHGNAEMMFDPKTQQPHTAHTSELVPFIYKGRKAELIEKDGKLSDIAPTMLYLMDIPQPHEMTGSPLVKLV